MTREQIRIGGLSLVLLSALAADGHAQVQLSAPMARPWGRFQEAALTPDRTRLVYAADQELYGVTEVFSVPVDGSAPAVKLSGTYGGEDYEYARMLISPDSRRVVWILDGVGRLMSAPVDGSAPAVQLASVGCASCDDTDFAFAFTPDGAHVLYRDEQYDRHPLYAVRADGSAPAVLVSEPDVRVYSFVGSADGNTVLYETGPYGYLWSRPIDASAPAVRLDPGLDSVLEPLLAPDGRVVRVAQDELLRDGERLYVVPLDGSAPPHDLTGPSVIGGHVESLVLADGGTSVVCRGDVRKDEEFELFVVPLDGSAPPRALNGTLVAGGDVQTFVLSDDERRVVYRADARVDGQDELFEAPLDGSSPPRRLSHALSSAGDVVSFALAAEGAMCVYLAAEAGVTTLWSARVDAPGRPRRLNGPLVAGGSVLSFALAEPSGEEARVVYRADAHVDERFELYSVPLRVPRGHALPVGAPPVTRLHAPARADWEVARDGLHVVHTTDANENGVPELRAVPVRGGPVVRLDLEPGYGGTAARVVGTTPGPGGRLVYLVRADYRTDQALVSVALTGDAWVRLNPLHARGPEQGAVQEFAAVPGGESVVYRADQEHLDQYDLYVVPSDGSAAPRKLHDAGSWSSRTWNFALTSDGTRVVQRADPDADFRWELFVAPLDASAPALALGSGAGVLPDFVLDAGGTQAVYLREDAGQTALFRVPLDASAPPTLLSGTLVSGGQVEAFALAPDAARVVFRADALLDGRNELWSVPLAGGTRVRLSPALASHADVSAFQVTPDSTRVLFRADTRVDGQFELYSVPIAGGTALELDPALTGSGNVQHVLVTPDSTRAVFVAQADTSKLWSVPVDGSAAPVRLDGPLVAGGSVRSDPWPALAAELGRVLYLADQETLHHVELWSAPLDGSAPAVRVSDPLGEGASRFALAPDGRHVLYLENPTPARPRTLTSTRAAGGGARLALSASDVAAGAFVLDPFGLRALFLGWPDPFGEPQLFLTPTDASQPSRRVDVDTAPYHRVIDQAFTSDARFALWLDQIPGGYGASDVVHLWSRRLPNHVRRENDRPPGP
ncbi:MAG: hypothetical protein ABL998_11500 [Planctomycetota bacterium]